ncbi:MAG: hypothetical protein ABSD38_32770 [Syntrophorhabdales bacterium]
MMEFLDASKIAQIGALVLVVVQYVKVAIPEKVTPFVSIALGILISFLFQYYAGKFDIVIGIVNGVLGAVGADTGYGFLSNSKSPQFTLASTDQLKKP